MRATAALRRSLTALLIALPLTLAATAAGADELSGIWRGRYTYPDGRQSIPFIMHIGSDQGRIGGVVHEPQSFGTTYSGALYGWIAGRRNGSSVAFTKRYDGTGGVGHSVQYRGFYDYQSRTIRGTWHIGAGSGGFFMRLVNR